MDHGLAFTVSALLCLFSANSVNEIISLKFALNSHEQLEASAGVGGVNRRRSLVEIQGCQLRPGECVMKNELMKLVESLLIGAGEERSTERR